MHGSSLADVSREFEREIVEVCVNRTIAVVTIGILALTYTVHPLAGFAALTGAFAYTVRRYRRRAQLAE
jgi:hypothetical protein